MPNRTPSTHPPAPIGPPGRLHRLRRLATLLLATAWLGGCAHAPPGAGDQTPDARLHTLYINEEGWLLDPRSGARIAPDVPAQSDSRAKLEAASSPEAAYVQAIIDNFRAQRAQRPGLQLTVFVHGGLNTLRNAAGRTDRFAAAMLAENQYPLFIGWNSGPLTNYYDHLLRVRKGERRPVLAPLTAPLLLAEDVLRALVHLPQAFYKEVRDASAVSISIKTEEEEDYDIRRPRLEAVGFQVVSEPPFQGVGRSYWSVANPLKLVTAPLLDGLGSGAWDSMLRRTDLVLSKRNAFEDNPPADAADYADTAAMRFLRVWQTTAGLGEVQVNLIGHSMGAIVVNNMLARNPALRVDNLVYMGGAARIKELEHVVVPRMARPEHQRLRFYNLSLDPYNELAESGWLDSVPRGSLLNWIDGIFGEVNSFKDRTVGGWWNITRSAEDVFRLPPPAPGLSPRVTLKRFAIGEGQGPQTHGAFGDHCFWQPRFWSDKAPAQPYPQCAQPGNMP